MDDARDIQMPTVQVTHIQLKNFRCFEHFEATIESPYVLFSGANGVGKTSLLEALYYTCYLRSFRTHTPRELIHFGKEEFFVKVTLDAPPQPVAHAIQVGFAPHKRLVKIDQKPIVSYKELMTYYRIVSITESDLELIQGSPQSRRLFLDQVLLFLDASYAKVLKDYRQVLEQRTALLQQRSLNLSMLAILTDQLWRLAKIIQARREELLGMLTELVNKRGRALFPHLYPLAMVYSAKRFLGESFEQFMENNRGLYEQEQRFRRTLFGTHLDDIHIMFEGQSSRLYASRGQQKLLVMLIKMAQLELLLQRGIPGICLLDDFMTDFDVNHMMTVIQALQGLGTQLIFTTPITASPLTDRLSTMGAQTIKLTD